MTATSPEALTSHPGEAIEPVDVAQLFHCLRGASGVVLAVSGGPDSIALMHLAAEWQKSGDRPRLAVASVDHGLQDAARAVADDVTGRARGLGFDAQTLVWTGDKPRRGIQEKARAARYGLLTAYARAIGASHLVTAHTLDDQAETLLIRLARGSGVSGLCGMRPLLLRDGVIHMRPLLGLRKAPLVALCRDHGWAFNDDPANRNPAFARARWRRLAPVLEREGLTSERLARLAERLARVEGALDAAADEAERAATHHHGDRFRCYLMESLARQPEEIVLRVLRGALVAVSGIPQVRLERLESLTTEILRQHGSGAPFQRSMHHCIVSVSRDGLLTMMPEGVRRRGARLDACLETHLV